MIYKRDSFPNTSFGGDNKQRINLSTFALDTINDDMIAFNNPKKTNFINRIIINFCQNADASIHFALENERARLENALSKVKDPNKNIIINELLKNKEEELQKKAEAYEKGESCLFRLQNEVADFLTGPKYECKEYKYYKNIGCYLKGVIEEYCTKPFVERELIYFADKVAVIENAIKENRKIIAETSRNICFTVYPYGIVRDRKSMYNYLVGYSVRHGTDEEMRPMSMRISGDINFELAPKRQSFCMNKAERKKLEDLINARGVQFLLGEEEEIHVVLTEAGVKQFNRQLHLRPVVTEIRENNEYVFKCSPLQAQIYFMKSGKEAYIKEPEYLRERMKNIYLEAYESYCDKEQD